MQPLCLPSTPPMHQTFSPQSSISADHVAECLAELTGEMVSELKSEIREMVNQVDELISPSSESGRTNSPDAEIEKCRHSESDSALVDLTSFHGVVGGSKLRLKDTRRSTIYSLSSQDSGINLSYQEKDSSPTDIVWRRSSGRENKLCTLVTNKEQDSDLADTLKKLKPRWHCPPKIIWKPTTEVSRVSTFCHYNADV